MLVKLKTFSLLGIEALPVEVDMSPGALPKTVLVGLLEAAVVENVEVIPVASLAQAVGFFAGTLDIEPAPSRLEELFESFSKYEDDFADVRGQEMGKRATTIAAAGAHNLLRLFPIRPIGDFMRQPQCLIGPISVLASSRMLPAVLAFFSLS